MIYTGLPIAQALRGEANVQVNIRNTQYIWSSFFEWEFVLIEAFLVRRFDFPILFSSTRYVDAMLVIDKDRNETAVK